MLCKGCQNTTHSAKDPGIYKWRKASKIQALADTHYVTREVWRGSQAGCGLLGNRHQMMVDFDWNKQLACSCNFFNQKHPDANMLKHPNDDSQEG